MNNNDVPAVVKIGEGTQRYFSPEIEQVIGRDYAVAIDLMDGVGGHDISFWNNLEFLPENYDEKTLVVVAYFKNLATCAQKNKI